MKRFLSVLVLTSVFAACNDDSTAEQEVDSLKKDVKAGWDSTKAEIREIKDSIRSRVGDRKDSTQRDSLKSK